MSNVVKSASRRYNHIVSEIDRLYHEVALMQGFSDSTMMILYTLADNDGSCLLSELVKQSATSKQTINSGLRRLEQDGIIILETVAGKSKRVVLTEKGRAVVHQTVVRVIAIENKIYSSWKREEWELYLTLTERYLREFKEEIEKL